MKPSTEDRAKGKFHEVKGDVKERIGRATKHPNMEDEGAEEKLAGKIQKGIGKVEKAFDE